MGLAPNGSVLVGVRALQGVGAALLVPGSLALISAAYADKEARGAAIGTWSAFSAMTSAIGPVVGGWGVAHGSWRWLFFFNVPLAIAVVILARGIEETRDEETHGGIDWLGAALAATVLGLLVYALIESEHGWSLVHGVLLGVGALTLAAFVYAESRHPAPMVPLALFRSAIFPKPHWSKSRRCSPPTSPRCRPERKTCSRAWVSAFRAVMIACAALSVVVGACGLLTEDGAERRRASPTHPRPRGPTDAPPSRET